MEIEKIRRLYLKTFLIALATAALIFLPAMIYDNGYFLFVGDFNSQQIPFYMNAHDSIRNGEWMWNWYTDLGSNFIGSYTFYLLGSPFFWLTIPLPSSWVPYSLGPLLMLKFATAAVTSCLYVKRYVRNDIYALIGGLLYAFSGFSIYNIFFNHFHEVIAFFPLLLITMDRLMEEDKRGFFALAVALNALVNYFFFFGEALFAVIYYVVRLICGGYPKGWKKFFTVLAEAVIGFLMSMVLMLPSALTVLQNSRVSNFASGFSVWLYSAKERIPAILFSFLFPPELPSKQILLPDASTKWTSLSAYLPIVGVAGALTYRRHRRRNWLSVLLLVLLIMALIPGLNSLFVAFNASYYARWFYMFTLMLVLASVIAMDRGWENGLKKYNTTVLIVTLVITLAIGLTPQFSGDTLTRIGLYDEDWPEYFVIICGSALLGGMCFSLFLFDLREKKQQFARNLVIAICIFSVLYGNFFIYWGKTRSYDTKEYLIPDAIEGEEKITIPDKDEVIRIDTDDSLINMGMFWKISCMRAFHSVVPSSIVDFYEYIGEERSVNSKIPESQYAVRGLLSVKYYFDRANYSTTFGPEGDSDECLMPGYSYYGDMAGYQVWENDYYIPMGYAYDTMITRSELDKVSDSSKAGFMLHAVELEDDRAPWYEDLMETCTAEDFTANKENYYADCEKHAAETVTDLAYTKTGLSCRSDFEEAKFVFFSIPYDDGWTCLVDGEEVTIERANIGFMGIVVEAGSHTIEFVYRTPGLDAGLLLTAVGALLWVGYMLLNRKFRVWLAACWKKGWKKYRELILYVIFGAGTTVVNFIVYAVCRNLLSIGVVPADVIAWILAVAFAFVTNKLWVFESKKSDPATLLKEGTEFAAARLFSLGFEVVFLWITVERLGWTDMGMKLLANILVIIMNYVFSKLLIFKKAGAERTRIEKKETAEDPEAGSGAAEDPEDGSSSTENTENGSSAAEAGEEEP